MSRSTMPVFRAYVALHSATVAPPPASPRPVTVIASPSARLTRGVASASGSKVIGVHQADDVPSLNRACTPTTQPPATVAQSICGWSVPMCRATVPVTVVSNGPCPTRKERQSRPYALSSVEPTTEAGHWK